MSKHFTADNYSEDSFKDIEEDEGNACNRIFLNFSREFRHPSKDHYNYLKVKELFKYLSERRDLQEMKVSGWLDRDENGKQNGKQDEKDDEGEGRDDEEYKDGGSESYYDEEASPKQGGQRFAMSRDFWYRKLNTLKAQKLDEAALEARDIPPDLDSKEPRIPRWIKTRQLPEEETTAEKLEDVIAEIDRFEKAVVKPSEKELKTGFVNVYENRKYFRSDRCE